MTRKRQTFGAEELAICLSHYDLGEVRSIKPFHRGSRRAPKVVIEAEKGKFLLKRRVQGRDDVRKVAFTHQVQLRLAGQNFPLPHLVGTRADNNSMLVLGNVIYEMFEFIDGRDYSGSLDATYHAGRVLGLYHKLLRDFKPAWAPPTGTYHNTNAIRQSIRTTANSMPPDSLPPQLVLGETVEDLEQLYGRCAAGVEAQDMADWPKQICHGDWHPGNMLFSDQKVVAVIDYDSARLQQAALDLANGALQFSILGGGPDPDAWPEQVDENRFKRFVRGYDDANVISHAELKAVPPLMCEAMIAEAVLPIAATGSFGRIEGFPFLQMIRRKVRWLLEHADELVHAVQD